MTKILRETFAKLGISTEGWERVKEDERG